MNLHEMAEQYILDNIKNETYKAGDMIPPEVELAKLLNISRPTMRQALSKLVLEGYLTRIKGKGTFVTERKLLHRNTSMISSYKSECAQNGLSIKTIVTKLALLSGASAPCADILSLAKSAKVVVLSRIRESESYHDGAPLVYTTIYTPAELLPDALSVDFEHISFYDLMKERGHAIVHTKKQLEVIPHNPEIAKVLKISPYEPIISIKTTGYTKSGRTVEYSESYYPSSISSFDIELWNKE